MLSFPMPQEAADALARIDEGAPAGGLESETLEFESDRSSPKQTLRGLAKAAACLANGRGGTVAAGVDDARSGSEAYTGTNLDPHEVRRYIFDALEPGLSVLVNEHTHRGTRLLAIVVPMGAAVHGVSGRVTRRVGRSCLPLSPDDIAALVDERAGRDPSAQRSGRSVGELDPAAVQLARRCLGNLTDERARWVDLSNAELCRVMDVAASDGELLVAGEQLFCSSGAEAVSYQHRTSAGAPPDVSERFAMPLITALNRTLEFVAARNRWDPLLLPDGQQLQLMRYPEDAVREALANALVHRRLDMTGPVQVEHFDDALAITSTGSLVTGVTMKNILTTASRPRNRLLARSFRNLGLIEELGTGIARMYRSMLRLGKPPPTFAETANSVRVTIDGGPPGLDFARFAARLDAPDRDDIAVLLVLRHLCSRSSASPADTAALIQRPPSEAARTLERMAEADPPTIEPVGPAGRGSKARYRLTQYAAAGLGPAVAYRRNSRREAEAAVAAHVRRHGAVTNRAVRNLLGVGTPRASVILRELVERRILERTSSARRGPGVEYGPGPLMPG